MPGLSDSLTKVELTNLGKVLYPEAGISKAKVIEHYIRAAPKMLYYLKDRTAIMNRFPNGVGGQSFYEKDAPAGTPPWVRTYKRYSQVAKRNLNYIICNDLDTLIWMANLAALEINMPLSRVGSYEVPDMAFFDIDPEPPAGFTEAAEAALSLNDELKSLGVRPYVKTSGRKGLHVLVPVVEGYNFRQTREFVHQVGRHMARGSDKVVSEFSHSRDPGTVFIDYLQNAEGRTMICPYSLRATPMATVSAPIGWDSLRKGIRPEDLNIFTAQAMEGDPWEGILEDRQKLG